MKRIKGKDMNTPIKPELTFRIRNGVPQRFSRVKADGKASGEWLPFDPSDAGYQNAYAIEVERQTNGVAIYRTSFGYARRITLDGETWWEKCGNPCLWKPRRVPDHVVKAPRSNPRKNGCPLWGEEPVTHPSGDVR